MTSHDDKRSLLAPPDTAARVQLTADADNAALRAVSTQDTASSEDDADPAFDSLLRAVAAAPSVGSAPTLPQPGDLLGEVEIIKEIGQGGMGRVYLARDLALGRLVAVKMLLARGDAADRAELNARFRVEAQATARLDHPNIVTVHTFGDWRGAPFLVMERLRGESLADRLDDAAQSRLPLDDALAITVQLLEGLDHAHKKGVVHRDLKPDNVFLREDGQVKLLDFGLAVLERETVAARGSDEVERTRRAGTPRYMAPEQWLGEPQDERTDLFAVGAILFTMLAGEVPFHNRIDVLEGRRKTSPLIDELPKALQHALDRALQRAPAQRFASAQEFLGALRALHAPADDAVGQPYRYLETFTEADAALFFGRESECSRLARTLRTQAAVAVVGPSGAGKSSLVQAGLLPLLRRHKPWQTFELVPSNDPMAALAALASELGGDAVSVERLSERPGLLGELARGRAQKTGSDVLIVADQFEVALQAALTEDARRAFGRTLSSLADSPEAPTRLIFTIREDQLSLLVGLEALGELVQGGVVGVFVLGPPSGRGLRDALVKPAARCGVTLHEDLVAACLEALQNEPVPLPLLELTASRLWDERDRESNVIPASLLASIGGLSGVLSRHAEEVYRALAADADRACARELLMRLVGADGHRRITPRADLVAGLQGAEGVLAHLLQGRLVRSAADGDGVELVHDALLEHWERLQNWVGLDLARRRLRDQLESAASIWRTLERPPNLLWSGAVLQEATSQLDSPPSPVGAEFLRASRRRAKRRRAVLVAAIAAVLLVAIGVAVASNVARLRVQEEEQRTAAERERADQLVEFMLVDLHERLSEIGQLDLLEGVVAAVDAYYQESDSVAPLRRAASLRQLGDIRRQQGELVEARRLYEASLAAAEEAGGAQSESARDEWAAGQEAMASVHLAEGDLAAAEAALLSSVAVRRASQRGSQDPKARRALSEVLVSLGDVYQEQGELGPSLEVYNEALALTQGGQGATLADADEAWGLDLEAFAKARALLRIGDVYFARGESTLARGSYDSALEGLGALVEHAPANARWKLTLAQAHLQVGAATSAMGRLEEAHRSTLAARKLYEELVAFDGRNASWRLQLVIAWLKESGDARQLGLLDDALMSSQRALELLGERSDVGAGVEWKRARALGLMELGDNYRARGEGGAALQAFEAALSLRRELVERDPTNSAWQRGLGNTAFRLGEMYKQRGDLGLAKSAMQEALGRRTKLVALDESNTEWLRDAAAASRLLGDIWRSQGAGKEAASAYSQAMGFMDRAEALGSRSDGTSRERAICAIKLGDVEMGLGQVPRALEAYRASVESFRQAAAGSDDVGRQRDLAMALNKVGDALRTSNDYSGAALVFEESVATMRAVVAVDSRVQWRRDLSLSLDRLGDMRAKDLGGGVDFQRARLVFEESTRIARELAAADPANTEWQRDLSVSIEKIAKLEVAAGVPDEAQRGFAESKEILEGLRGRDPSNALWTRDLALTLRALAELEGGADAKADLQRSLTLLDGLEPGGDVLLAIDRADVSLAYAKRVGDGVAAAELRKSVGFLSGFAPEALGETGRGQLEELRRRLGQ